MIGCCGSNVIYLAVRTSFLSAQRALDFVVSGFVTSHGLEKHGLREKSL